MYDWFLIALTVIFAVIVAKLILKKYNAIFIFFASGVIILMSASLLTGNPILGKDTSAMFSWIRLDSSLRRSRRM